MYKWSSLVFIPLNMGCHLVNIRQRYEDTIGKTRFWVMLGVWGPDSMTQCPESHLSCGNAAKISLVSQQIMSQ